MKLSLDQNGFIRIESPIVSLGEGRPMLNGVVLEGCTIKPLPKEANELRLSYHTPIIEPGFFGLEITRRGVEEAWLRYWLEGLPEETDINSFGLHFKVVENIRAYLRNGYYSWDGSEYIPLEALTGIEPEAHRPEVGYAMTQLLPLQGEGSLVVGFERHNRFQHTFVFGARQQTPELTVLTLWDRKDRTGLKRCESEWLLLFTHPEVEEALREWARRVARAAPNAPRLSGQPITGWCSWYNLYAYINEENILHHLQRTAETARREELPMRVFQIDDGFTPEMGDWLEVKPQFPRGMKPILDEIREAGFVPGLWIAPFMVGNRSQLYQEHPDWVVRDALTGGPLVQMQFYGEFRWHKRSEEYYILDTTRSEALDYLRKVFRTWRWQWGCEYFKTDFMYFSAHYGPDRAVWHQTGLTRIEIWCRTAEMIRQEIGEALWLGCGCPLWAAIGLVDGIRIGRDMGVKWKGDLSAESLLHDQATRNFTNNIFWQTDPDCVLLRQRFHHLTDSEVRSLAIFAGMAGGVLMTSDDLSELSPERLRLWKLLLPKSSSACRFPLLSQSALSYEHRAAGSEIHRARRAALFFDPVLVQVRSLEQGQHAVFIFNTGEAPTQRTLLLNALALPDSCYVHDWIRNKTWPEKVEALHVSLAAHDGALFFLSVQPFEKIPETLG